MSNSTYLFYDIETSGLNPCFDQVVEFAAIRTDLSLNELERHHLSIRLNPDVIPHPEAFMIHRLSLNTVQQGQSEVEALTKIHRLLNTPGTISLGYNTLGFDDEFLRFSFYRNLLSPYTHQYANGCQRMDLYPMTIMAYLFKPSLLRWPMKNNKISLKLENLNQENQLAEGQAHHAMVDVEASVALARKLMQDRSFWDYLCTYFVKSSEMSRIEKLDEALMIQGKFGANIDYCAPVFNLGQHHYYRNQSLWLRLDLIELQSTTPDSIAENTYVIRKRPAEPPLLLPALERYIAKIDSARLAIAHENKAWLKANPKLLQMIGDHHQQYRYPEVKNIDADAALYTIDFPTPAEEIQFQRFHQAKPDKKSSVIEAFTHSLRKEQAIRIMGRHYFEYLNDVQRSLYENYLQKIHRNESIIDYRNEHRLTPQSALEKIDLIKKNSTLNEEQLAILEELNHFITQIHRL